MGNHGGMVHLRNGSSSSILDHVIFDHMGDTNAPIDGSLVVSDNVTLNNITITDSESAGVYIDSDATPTIGSLSVTTSALGINIRSGSAVIDNADLTSNATGAAIGGGSPQLTNSMIGATSGDGIQVSGGTPTITGNTIEGNQNTTTEGILISGGAPVISSNAINNSYEGIEISGLFFPDISSNTFTGNTRDVLLPLEQVDKVDLTTNGLSTLHLSGVSVNSNTTLSTTYVYQTTADITVANGVILTLQPGVLMEFPWVSYDLFIDGTLDAQGTLGNEIVFQGSDPNGSTHGGMVHLRSGSSSSVLDHVIFDHMGDTNAPIDGSLVVSDNVTLNNITITDSESAGVYIDSDATPTIGSLSVTTSALGINIRSGSAVIDNADLTSNATGAAIGGGSPQLTNSMIGATSGDGIQVSGGTPTITGNTIEGNQNTTTEGILISGGAPVISSNAINNSYEGIEISGLFFPDISSNTFTGNTRDVLLPLEQVDKVDLTTNGLSTLHLSGVSVNSNTTLSTTYVYQTTADITVANGVILTLQPGVLMEFPWVSYDLFIDGTLDAQGTLGNEIVFQGSDPNGSTHGGMVHLRSGSSSSVLDHVIFDHMGDTNAPIDGSLVVSDNVTLNNITITDSESAGVYIDSDATPTIGSLSVTTSALGINIRSGSAVIDNADLTSNATGAAIGGGSPQLTNSMIGATSGDGIQVSGGTPTITGNTIEGNQNTTTEGILISGGAPVISSNAINNSYEGIEISGLFFPDISSNTFTGNTRDVLLPLEQVDKVDLTTNGLSTLHLSGVSVNSNTTLSTTYVYQTTADITVANGVILTLQPGVLMEFPWVSYDLFIDGTLDAQGTLGNEIVFQGSDPNGSTHGGMVHLRSGSSSSVLDHVIFDHMGDTNSSIDGSLVVSDNVTLNNITITDSESAGIWLDNSVNITISSFFIDTSNPGIRVVNADATFDNGQIRNSPTGMLVLAGSPSINNASFFNNAFGINNSGGGSVDATNNWWGDASGPLAPTNLSGLGDEVTVDVVFSPFLTSSPFPGPNPPTDLIRTVNIFAPSVTLDWTDNSDDELEFSIQRSDGNNSTFVEIATVGANVVTYTDNSIADNDGYYYRVTSRNPNGESIATNQWFASTISQPGNALDFNDGLNNYVDVADDVTLEPSGAYTLEGWIKLGGQPTSNQGYTIVQKGTADAGWDINGYFLLYFNDGANFSLVGGHVDNANGLQLAQITQTLNTSQWYHVALTYDQSNIEIYLDGISLGTTPITNDPDHTGDGQNLKIGVSETNAGGLADYFLGQIDELRIWDVARTETEIRQKQFETVNGDETGLVAYYRFDQGMADNDNTSPAITILPDYTINQNDGTLQNFGLTGTSSNWVSSTALAGLPFAPSDLIVTETSGTRIDLDWTDNSFNEGQFIVERSDGNNTNFVQIGTSEAEAPGFADNTVTLGSGYFYRVLAQNASGNSGFSNEKFGSTVIYPGNALDFDGSNDEVTIPDDPDFQFGTGDFTFETWFYFDGTDQVKGILAKRNPITPFEQVNITIRDGTFNGGVGKKVFAEVLPDGRTFSGMSPGANDRFLASANDLTIGWHHVAIVQDYDVGLTLYVDGVNEGTSTTSHGGLTTNIVGQPLTIGSYNGDGFFGGQIDEVRIWNDIRTESEILDNLLTGLSGDEQGLIAYYKFDQGDGGMDNTSPMITLLPDRSTNNHNGTLSGFDLSGASSNWVTSEYINSLPASPSDFFLQEISTNQINLSWIDNASDEIGFSIQRSDNDNTAFVELATVSPDVTTFSDFTVSQDNGYYYRVVPIGNVLGIPSPEKFVSTLTPPGNALDFGTNNEYVAFDGVADAMAGNQASITVEMWIKAPPNFVSNRGSVLAVNSETGNTNKLLIVVGPETDNALTLWENTAVEITGPVIADNTWHHVAYVRTAGTGELFMDGISVGTHTATYILESTDRWSLGQEYDGTLSTSDFYEGQVDELRIWNVSKSQSEITTNSSTDLAGNESGLVLYYPFDQGMSDGNNSTVDLVKDNTIGTADGALIGFSLNGTTSNWVASNAFTAQPFITTWQTDNTGTSGPNQITIPTTGAGYNYNIYWEQVGSPGNNGSASNLTGDHTITFPEAGTYRVEILGQFPRIFFDGGGDRRKLLTVEQWGDIAWSSMNAAFRGCRNLTITATDSPNLAAVTDMSYMFALCDQLTGDLSTWNIGNVTNMEQTFAGATVFNGNVGTWNVSNVTNMRYMFLAAQSFNQSLNSWNTGNVLDMQGMFEQAATFNGSIGSWNVGSVTNMSFMFTSAPVFNRSLNSWNVSSVVNMEAMFNEARAFNGNISSWNVGNVTNMDFMFSTAEAFNNDIGNWDVSKVTSMQLMFDVAISFNQDIGRWNVAEVLDMDAMFAFATSFNQDLSTWNVSKVTTMRSMFDDAFAFDQNLGSWDMSAVTDVTRMLDNSGMSTTSYDQTLVGWSSQTLQSGLSLDATGVAYCAGETARDNIITTYSWTINDGGLDCSGVPALNLALDFDGADDYVDVTILNSGFIGLQDAFSVELWVNLEPVYTGSTAGSIFGINDNNIENRLLLYVNDRQGGTENTLGIYDTGGGTPFELTGPIIG